MKPFAIAPAVFLCCALAVLLSGTTGCNWIQEEESNRPLQPDNAVTPEDREKWYDESKGNSVKLHTRQEEDKISREVSEKVELPPVKAPDPIKVKAKDLDYKPVIEGIVPEAFAGIGEVTADFNLKNAPTVDVIPIFAQMLKFNYVVEGALAGNITMAMHEKVTRRQLWEIFTQMLHSVGVIAEYDGKVVHIRNANAVPNQLSLAALNPNVEMGIFRFKHIPVSGVINQIKTFLLRDSRFVELAASNTLLMLDTKETVERVRMLIEHLDQPYGTNRHKLVIPCATLNPTQLVQELKEILPVLGFPVAGNNNAKDNPGLLVMQPQERLKVIIASAPNAEVLGEVARWVNVLDQPDGNQEQLYVYEIIHSRPELLIKALATMFTVSATLSTNDVNGNVTSNDNMGTPGSLMSNSKVAPGTVFDTPVRIWGDGVHNRLTIRTLPRTYAMIKAYLERIDTIPAQVLLHVLCVEVSLSDSIAFGIEFKTQTTINGWESSTGTDYKYLTPGTSSQYGIQYLLSNPENPKEFAYMNALAGQANIRVISSPQ
ncbi:MAG: hypothetical protein J6R85_04300, partial [Lentisphaeria bacterium]|nr:hypothetical protein [Lentisphaeria bacterium]